MEGHTVSCIKITAREEFRSATRDFAEIKKPLDVVIGFVVVAIVFDKVLGQDSAKSTMLHGTSQRMLGFHGTRKQLSKLLIYTTVQNQ